MERRINFILRIIFSSQNVIDKVLLINRNPVVTYEKIYTLSIYINVFLKEYHLYRSAFWRQFKIKRTYLQNDLIGDKFFVKQTKTLSSSKERRF